MTVRRLSRLILPAPMNDTGDRTVTRVLQGVGIDLVSLRRIRHLTAGSFASQYRNFLTVSEQNLLKGSSRRREYILAKIISAKEAFFKASGFAWMGPHGWRDFQVSLLSRGNFSVQASLRRNRSLRAIGSFFENSGQVGALVTIWRNDALASS